MSDPVHADSCSAPAISLSDPEAEAVILLQVRAAMDAWLALGFPGSLYTLEEPLPVLCEVSEDWMRHVEESYGTSTCAVRSLIKPWPTIHTEKCLSLSRETPPWPSTCTCWSFCLEDVSERVASNAGSFCRPPIGRTDQTALAEKLLSCPKVEVSANESYSAPDASSANRVNQASCGVCAVV